MTGIQCAECGRFCGEADFALGHCEYTPETEFGHERIEWLCRRCSPTKVTRLTKADEETVSRILDEEGDDWEDHCGDPSCGICPRAA